MRKLCVDLSKLQSGTIVNKVCITPEMAAKNEIPKMNQKETGCEIKNQQQHGNTYTMDMVCDGKMKGKGVSTIVFSSRSEEHTSELQSLMRNSYAVFCMKKKNTR